MCSRQKKKIWTAKGNMKKNCGNRIKRLWPDLENNWLKGGRLTTVGISCESCMDKMRHKEDIEIEIY
uniref:Uncharacterized protein n=1 Tax=Arion vulgaris TaxID=1028688 RepID=A0A0B7AQ27_9EUPU